jgi:transcriptional regulator with XRE-family HTH domain
MTATMTPIRITLREAREAAGLTQVQLAELADVRQATVSEMERSVRRSVDLAILDRLCRVLNVEPGDLLVREQDKPKRRKR